MKNNHAILALAVFLCVLLLIAVFIDESEMRNMKTEMQTMQETITTMQTENANLIEEYNALKRQNTELEEQLAELQQPIQQSYSYSYYDSEYDEMSAKDYIAQRESGMNYEAQNGQYYGKYQLQIDMLGGDLSPENQEETAERYVLDRYGSWENAREFWNNHGWY